MSTFPTVAGAAGEQLGLSLGGTLQGRYDAWRRTSEGLLAFMEIERRVLARANRGDAVIEINDVVADVRRERQSSIDNNHRAYIARTLISRHPLLGSKIRIRRTRGR